MNVTPVLLAGGSGTRLWPLSRKSYPKQFSELMGTETLFQSSAKRLVSGDKLAFSAPLVLTNSDFRFIVTEQLAEIGVEPSAILIEPEGKNTAPAVLAAALQASAHDPSAILLVAPSDHVIPDAAAFHHAISNGLKAVKEGQLVTFGIEPSQPETGYGYLELAQKPDGSDAVPLRSFVEKPNFSKAKEMVAAGNYMWNSGIFLFSAKTIIEAFETYASQLCKHVRTSVENAQSDLDFLRLDPAAWSEVESISIDYAVMEKADNLSVVPFFGAWSDLGGWDAVWRESNPNEKGVVTSSHATAIDCTNTLLRTESSNQEIVGIGLKNIMVISMPDAVLVADMSKAQDVKRAVEILKEKGALQAESFPKDHRPWGWYESLVIGERFQVKRIHVHPGASLSLQSHFHRSEHWIVVEGTARVTVDENTQLLSENQSVYIPLGAIHRMENPGKVPMVLIEVQTGTYLGEDDIVRYEDLYSRD